MADLTLNLQLTIDDGWTEITATLGIGASEKWALEVVGDSVELAATDANAAPAATTRGQQLSPGAVRTSTRQAGHFWWARSAGASVLVAAEVLS